MEERQTKGGRGLTILVAQTFSSGQGHSSYVLNYFEKVRVSVRSVALHKLI